MKGDDGNFFRGERSVWDGDSGKVKRTAWDENFDGCRRSFGEKRFNGGRWKVGWFWKFRFRQLTGLHGGGGEEGHNGLLRLGFWPLFNNSIVLVLCISFIRLYLYSAFRTIPVSLKSVSMGTRIWLLFAYLYGAAPYTLLTTNKQLIVPSR